VSALLKLLKAGETITLPETVTADTLRKYLEIAETAIRNGRDPLGVQAARREAINLLLKSLGLL
jgi:hypothetical protein